MQGLLQAAKVCLVAASVMLGVFSLHMLFGSGTHAHDMGLGRLFTSIGLGVLAGLVAAFAATLLTIFGKSAELPRLKRLNLILLIVLALLAALSAVSVSSGSRRALRNLLGF